MKYRSGAGAVIAGLALFLLSAATAPASAAEHRIVLLDPAHRDLSGVSINSDLLSSIQPEGRLGGLVFFPAKEPRKWFIDAALIEDVQALAEKEGAAQDWLAKLKKVAAKDQVFPLPYGHPDIPTIKRLAPTELNYYYTVGKSRLQKFFGKSVETDRSFVWTVKTTKIRPETIRAYNSSRRSINLLRTVVPSDQLDLVRSRLALLLSTDIDSKNQYIFAQNAYTIVTAENHKLRIVPGKYRLSSQHEKIPITLINDFEEPVIVSLRLTPLNSRINVSNIEKITLAEKSKLQLSVPFTVIASGTTAVLVQFTNERGTPIVDSAILSLNLAVISPAVAWFTTGAAVLLFLAAITQNVRRVRKRTK
jgi:hypothetical protein